MLKRTGLSRSLGGAIGRWCAAPRTGGVDVVAPAPHLRLNPRPDRDGVEWVVYPFVDGRTYAGTVPDIAAAGALLGAIHSADSCAAAELALVPEAVRRTPEWVLLHAARADAALRGAGIDATGFERYVEQRGRSGRAPTDLPIAGCSADFKASNLVYTAAPVLVDADHAARMPRLYDLATAALLFHNDLGSAPHRLWTRSEWRVFVAAYGTRVELTPSEYDAWPAVLSLAWLDQGVWLLGHFPEGWADPAEAAYLSDLATSDLSQFDLLVEEG